MAVAPQGAPQGGDTHEMLGMAEEELARLQRQLRIMEEDRVAYSEETNKKLLKQRKIISILRQEQQSLLEDFTIATCQNQKRRDKKTSKEITKLVETYEKTSHLVETELQQLEELNVQIKKLEQDIKLNKPKKIVTEEFYQSKVQGFRKTEECLKNRHDSITKRFCCVLTENKQLRETIDHLLKERSNFNLIWDKLLKDIQTGKKFILDLIEQATMAFDQREEWGSKLQALKKRAIHDLQVHTEEMRVLQRSLDHYQILREFILVKGQKRILRDLELKEEQKRGLQAENLQNDLQVHEEILLKIRNFGGEQDVEKIAVQFVKQEEENFALFNYVNELNVEIEGLQAQVKDFCEKIEEQIKVCLERSKEQQATLASVQEELLLSQDELQKHENEAILVQNTVTLTLKRIEELFDKLSCDRGPILYLLGPNTSITLHNVMIYLGTIEKKISDLVVELFFAEKSLINIKN